MIRFGTMFLDIAHGVGLVIVALGAGIGLILLAFGAGLGLFERLSGRHQNKAKKEETIHDVAAGAMFDADTEQ